VAFNRDGQVLATGSEDNTIILWDAATGQPLGEPLTGHHDIVISVTFSPDGQTLASGSGDGTIILWDVNFKSWQERVCRRANRNLSRAEWARYVGLDIPYRPTCPNLPSEQGVAQAVE
jgi:WD40 repeat protein